MASNRASNSWPVRVARTGLYEKAVRNSIWGRRREPVILWLEGADDLTPEAQAFLRRILETHSSDVQFVLECRDAGRLQEPIRSRCALRRLSPPRRPTYGSSAKRRAWIPSLSWTI